MKKLTLIIIAIIFSGNLYSQSLDDAYKREKGYLRSQKEALMLLKAQLHTNFLKNKKMAELEIQKKQSELSQLNLQNQTLIEEFKSLEKISKESVQVVSQLEKQNLKIAENLSSVSAKLGIIYSDNQIRDHVQKFEKNLDEVLVLIDLLSHSEWKQHAFLNEENQLIAGEVKFNGLYSAWGKIGDKVIALAPYNKDYLREIPKTSQEDIYIFTPDFSKVSILSSKTWKESVADAIPALVLSLIMLTVFSLFIMLARAE